MGLSAMTHGCAQGAAMPWGTAVRCAMQCAQANALKRRKHSPAAAAQRVTKSKRLCTNKQAEQACKLTEHRCPRSRSGRQRNSARHHRHVATCARADRSHTRAAAAAKCGGCNPGRCQHTACVCMANSLQTRIAQTVADAARPSACSAPLRRRCTVVCQSVSRLLASRLLASRLLVASDQLTTTSENKRAQAASPLCVQLANQPRDQPPPDKKRQRNHAALKALLF